MLKPSKHVSSEAHYTLHGALGHNYGINIWGDNGIEYYGIGDRERFYWYRYGDMPQPVVYISNRRACYSGRWFIKFSPILAGFYIFLCPTHALRSLTATAYKAYFHRCQVCVHIDNCLHGSLHIVLGKPLLFGLNVFINICPLSLLFTNGNPFHDCSAKSIRAHRARSLPDSVWWLN